MPSYYGLTNTQQLQDCISAACALFPNSTNATALLLETAAVETRLGTYPDPTPNGAGRGVFQCDPIGFKDVLARTPAADLAAIKTTFNIDLTTLPHAALDVSPLAAALVARLFYRLVPKAIPSTLNERADYWKRYYNTAAGKGTPSKYLAAAALIDGLCNG